MDIEAEEQEAIVEPIMVSLSESPTREQLMELSSLVGTLYANGEMGQL